MHPQLTRLLARERQQELYAAVRGRARDTPSRPLFASIAVRLATANDREALERLAELDSTEPPRGPTLVGELLQRPVAALSLSDGRVIADPFVATGDIVALLRLRARQLGPGRPRRWNRSGPQRLEASNQPTSARRKRIMKPAIVPNVHLDRYDAERWPALLPDMPDGAREATDARPVDSTQGKKMGSEPRRSQAGTPDRIGSVRRPDPWTQGRG
jgi:hypothetical protein